MNDEAVKDLCAAVVERAVMDYAEAISIMRKHPGNESAADIARECERFFRRDMELYSDIDGESIIRAVRARCDENDNRRG